MENGQDVFYAAACRLRLSDQEARLAVLARDGLSAADAARELGIAVGTANTHYERARRKVRVATKTQLVAAVYEELLRASAG